MKKYSTEDIAFKIGICFRVELGLSWLQVKEMEITDIIYLNNTVTICSNRPGLIIGAKGNRIDVLIEHLKEKVEGISICLKENKTNNAIHSLYGAYNDPLEE